MSKRIYVGKDVEETARKTGIPVTTLRKAALGQIELTPVQLAKLRETLGASSESVRPPVGRPKKAPGTAGERARPQKQELDDYP